MGKPNQQLQQTVDVLCEELDWGLRSFYAAKYLFEAQLRLTPYLFDTFYFACLDQSALILARMLIVKENAKRDESINLRYLANLAKQKRLAQPFGRVEELDVLFEKQDRLFDENASLIATLKNQRDRNLAHLDRHHINDSHWKKSQLRLDLAQVENLYLGLGEILSTYHHFLFGTQRRFDQWETMTQKEVDWLTDRSNETGSEPT